ncbi:hypothetical protein [Pseudomonas mucidolens]|uniref:Uncharacterized protein n=1 Tax=Pseudomonas mucidolens TaxID=46679 RepID=A0A1H2MTM2_9PSED|nr:hypothetical protein [Pseudomonas mucidolens]SDU96422.1 hypothetical protein SAMN05216202_2340 [Pseudomonas mucidolens]SQH33267.1 Uncharacterised protein [Pseudomonas mucidolens]
MNFKTFVLPELHGLATALRAKLRRGFLGAARPRIALISPSARISLVHFQAYWRLRPNTGHLVEQRDHTDPQDPQSRNVSSLLAKRV